jgi:hypothetical protein
MVRIYKGLLGYYKKVSMIFCSLAVEIIAVISVCVSE